MTALRAGLLAVARHAVRSIRPRRKAPGRGPPAISVVIMAALDCLDTVCVPHGTPIRSGARAVLATAVPEADWR
ncbi:hypothetical protein SNOUR_30260 [Streptomyces noursei ATCC 11455]|nr:hypothetical protein SNOUR_30260 [Streptomyces noursei ATCC 11455]